MCDVHIKDFDIKHSATGVWWSIFSMALIADTSCLRSDREMFLNYIKHVEQFFVCKKCRVDFTKFVTRHPPGDVHELFSWAYKARDNARSGSESTSLPSLYEMRNAYIMNIKPLMNR